MKNVLIILCLLLTLSISAQEPNKIRINKTKEEVLQRLEKEDIRTARISDLEYEKDTLLLLIGENLLAMHNEVRAKNNVAPLVLNEKLNLAAQRHAEDMFKKNFRSHTGKNGSTFTSRAKKAGYKSAFSGENIAWGQNSITEVIAAWVDSPGHFRNMISGDFKDVGFGYCNGIWVAVFGRQK